MKIYIFLLLCIVIFCSCNTTKLKTNNNKEFFQQTTDKYKYFPSYMHKIICKIQSKTKATEHLHISIQTLLQNLFDNHPTIQLAKEQDELTCHIYCFLGIPKIQNRIEQLENIQFEHNLAHKSTIQTTQIIKSTVDLPFKIILYDPLLNKTIHHDQQTVSETLYNNIDDALHTIEFQQKLQQTIQKIFLQD